MVFYGGLPMASDEIPRSSAGNKDISNTSVPTNIAACL